MTGVAEMMTLAGTVVTTLGTICVAAITTGYKRQTKQHADDIEAQVLRAIEELKGELNANSRMTVANTRNIIGRIYSSGKEEKALTEKEWNNVVDLYEAYKSVTIDGHTPNSWCDELVNEMRTWKKI